MKDPRFLVVVLGILLLTACTSEIPVQESGPEPLQKSTEDPSTTEPAVQTSTQIKTAGTGEPVDVDYLSYTVTKAETFTEMGTPGFGKETSGKFVKVYLDITNNAKETKQIFTPRFTLIDSEERQFDRVSDDIFYISDGLELGKQLQPSLTASGAIVFELPKDSDDLRLAIRGDWMSARPDTSVIF